MRRLFSTKLSDAVKGSIAVCIVSLLTGTLSWGSDYQLETIVSGLNHPWSVAFLPNGEFLITERNGGLLRISADGRKNNNIEGVPDAYVAQQGGLFDIVLDPDFRTNNTVYLSYAHGEPSANGTGIIRATLGESRLINAERILLVATVKDTPVHYGGRMLFLPDGTLLLTTGDGFDYREKAQDLDAELGKVLRITSDGTVARDNPFTEQGRSRVWTYGHRNPQGLALNGDTGEVYLHEHGPRGGDELNILSPGKNYGWPAISLGVDYSGAHISPFKELPDMEQPAWFWVPSIAPSGLAWYGGDAFPQWQGDLFVGALVNKDVRRLDMQDGKIVGEEVLFGEINERIRDVRAGPDGYLYLLTDSNKGKLIRVKPKD